MNRHRIRVAAIVTAGAAGVLSLGVFFASAEIKSITPQITNFWPFSVIERLSGDRTFKHSGAPVFTRNERPEEDRNTFRPLITSVTEKSDQSVTVDFLPPIGHATKSEDERSFHLFPLFSHRKWTAGDGSQHQFTSVLPIYHYKRDGEQKHRAIFPFYMAGTAGSVSYPIPFKSKKDYTAVFPLYGNLYGALGNDRVSFAFWPLYTRIEKKYAGSEEPFVKHQFLWPFITVGSGGGYRSFKFWPLYGETRKEGHYVSRFALWPLFNVTHNLNPDTAQAKDIVAGLPIYWDIQEGRSHSRSLFPFYGKRTTPDLERSFKMWPLSINTNYIKEGYATKDYLWPIFSKTEGTTTGFKVWPLYGTRKKSQLTKSGQVIEDRTSFYLWTLGKYERSLRPDSKRTYNRLFPLFVVGRYDDQAGYRQRQIFIWPLVAYQEDSLQSAKAFSFPNLLGTFEAQFPMIQEVYSPLWRVVDYAEQGGESRLSLLWNFVDVRKDNGQVALTVGPFFSLQRDPTGMQTYTLLSSIQIFNRGSQTQADASVRRNRGKLPTVNTQAFNDKVAAACASGVGWMKSMGSRMMTYLSTRL